MILPRIKEYKDIQGWLAPNEATHLYYYASQLPEKDNVVVEIGSWKGKSTLCLARGLSRGTVFAIDPFDAAGEEASKDLYQEERGEEDLLVQFNTNMSSMGVGNKVTALKGYSNAYVNTFDQIDLLFIDGDHSIEGCRFDYEHFAPKLAPGGILIFHDYRPKKADMGPTWVVNNLVLPSGEFEKLGLYRSLWVGRKLA